MKQPELTQLIGLLDGDGDRVFISRLDRPDGSRGYLLAIRSGEMHGDATALLIALTPASPLIETHFSSLPG